MGAPFLQHSFDGLLQMLSGFLGRHRYQVLTVGDHIAGALAGRVLFAGRGGRPALVPRREPAWIPSLVRPSSDENSF